MRKLCKIVFSATDASLYVIPYSPTGKFFFGAHELPQGQLESTLDFRQREARGTPPKLSLHQSGRLHIRHGTDEAGPVWIAPFERLRGEHLASIHADKLETLPEHASPLEYGRTVDVPIENRIDAEAGHLALFLSAVEDALPASATVIPIKRPTLPVELFLGIRPTKRPPLGDELSGQGVVVIAGWDPVQPPDAAATLLVIRGL